MPDPTPVVNAESLTLFLKYPEEERIGEDAAALALMVATGWLRDAAGTWPTEPVPDQIKSWLFELSGIAYENPTSMNEDNAGDVGSAWMDRRSQILKTARAWAGREVAAKSTGLAVSRGCFPKPLGWPAG